MPSSSIFISGPGHLPETHFLETLEVLKLWFPDQQHRATWVPGRNANSQASPQKQLNHRSEFSL